MFSLPSSLYKAVIMLKIFKRKMPGTKVASFLNGFSASHGADTPGPALSHITARLRSPWGLRPSTGKP